MTRRAHRNLLLTSALAGALLHGAARAADLPVLGSPGGATVSPDGANALKVDLNDRNRVIDWQSFDVAPGKAVNFTTTDTAGRYAVLNRVTTNDSSEIGGMLNSSSNIAVWLSNPAGITFSNGGGFSGGSLVLTTAAVNPTSWTATMDANDPNRATTDPDYLVPLTGAGDAAKISLDKGSAINATERVAVAAQTVTASGRIRGSEVELVAATALALPFGAGSPLGVRIDKGTKVGKVTVGGSAQIDAGVIRLAGASQGGQAAYLLQVDDGAQLNATVVAGKVVLAAGVDVGNGVAGDGVTLGTVPADVGGPASIGYSGRTDPARTVGATLRASGDIATTTAIGATGAIRIGALGNATIGAALTSTGGDVAVASGGATLVQSAVSAGGAYTATGRSVTLGTAGTAVTQSARGAVTITATGGLLAGRDGLTLQSGSAGADAALTLAQTGTGGIVLAPATELIGGTYTAGPPAAYGFGADVVVSAVQSGQPLNLGNVHARALTLPPSPFASTVTAGDIVVNDALKLGTGGAIRLRSGMSLTGDVALTAGSDVTGLARAAAATDGRAAPGYDRADLTALAAGRTVTVSAATAQLGTVTAGTGMTVAAGDGVAIVAGGIDLAVATAANGALRLTSTQGEVRLGSGVGATDAVIAAATGARLGSLTARTGDASATATAGDVTGLALTAAAGDGRLVAGYGRADVTAQAAAGTAMVKAAAGNAQLGTIAAGAGAAPAAGEQVTVQAGAIDVAAATSANGALRLTAMNGEVRLGSGVGGTDVTVGAAGAAGSARIGSLTAITGNLAVTAEDGDLTGLARAAPATDGRLVTGYDRADLAASAAAATITVQASSGYAQLGTVTAGTGITGAAGDQIAADARAIDVASATARNGALRLTAAAGEVRVANGVGGTDAIVEAATSARIASLTATTGDASIVATAGDVTGLALAAPAVDGRLVAGYGRADLAAQAAAGTVLVRAAAGSAQLGTAVAGSGVAVLPDDQLAVDAQVIDAASATAQNGALRLTSSVGAIRLGAGAAGTAGTVDAATSARIGGLVARTGSIAVIARAGDVTGLALAAPAVDGRLVAGYGRADLAAQAADRTITVAANDGYAQLGTVTAGTGATLPAGDQIAVDARAIDAITADARNGALRLTSGVGEVRVASGRGGTGGTVMAATDARVGDLATRTGAIAITATAGDATGLALATAATDSRPATGYGLTTLDAGGAIRVTASDDVQLGAIRAATDIDIDAHPAAPATATADEIAWLSGPVGATAGHYRATGGSVVLGVPGGIGQSAGTDLIVRSLAGDIAGGAGLTLASGVGGTGAASQLILYSAAGIALPGDTALIAGAGQYADVGLAAAPALPVTLGTVSARRIGTAVIDASQPTGYRIDAALVLPNPITARTLVTTADLVIDTTSSGTASDIVLDAAQSTAGGINLATTGNLFSSQPALSRRTSLTALDGIVVHGASALLGAVSAGTGVGITVGQLDALAITGNAGDVALRTSGDMRVDSVNAHGDGGDGPATLLADPAIMLSGYATPGPIRTAGDIDAASSGDITGTAAAPGLFGSASFNATNGGVTLLSDAIGKDEGLLALATVVASGGTAGHRDANVTGRQIDVATGIDATGGSSFVTARQLGSQTQVGATVARVTAADDVAIAIGYGTAPAGGGVDNGSLRVGTVRATAGSVTIAAQDGSVTGLAGTADALDPAHARASVSAGGDIGVAAGRLVQLGELSGHDVAVSAGDDLLADVSRQGSLPHQDGAIDIAHLFTGGVLALGAVHGATADGASGIRLGARAGGSSDGGLASQAGTTATLRTLGTLGDIVIADGLTVQRDLAVAGIANIRAATLTSTAGGISLATSKGDISGLVLPAAATDGRMIAGYGRADLAALAAGQPIAAAADGIVQLDTATAGAGTGISPGEQIAIDASGIDIVDAAARNGALRLTSTAGEVRLGTGIAGTAANVAAAASARIGMLTTRTGSIGVAAATGDVTGLVLPPAAADARLAPAYDRADLTAQAVGTGITVAALAGIAQLGPVTAGAGDTTAASGGITVDAGAIDVTTADARNAALALTSTVGETRLAAGTAATDATILAAGSARIGTLATRTGAIAVTAIAGDVTGSARPAPADDGRLVATYDRADLTALAAAQPIAVKAAGAVQLGTALAGSGDTVSAGDQIALDAGAIDVSSATARNGGLRLSSTLDDARLAAGAAGTDATIRAATNARIGTLATRTGSIGVAAATGDVTGLALTDAAADGRIAPAYGRADLTAQSTATDIAVTAAGLAQLGTVIAGAGDTIAPAGGIGVTAAGIDLVTADARNAALQLSSTGGETRLAAGTAGTDATVTAADAERIGTLAARTGSIAVTAAAGDVTGLLLMSAATDGRLVGDHGRAELTAQAAGMNVTVKAAAGTVQLGAVTAGTGDATAPGDGIAVGARAIDIATVAARNAAVRLASTAGDVRLAAGTAGTDAAIAAAADARIGTLATRTGSIAVTASAGETSLAAGSAATDATIRAATSARIGDLTAAAGAIAITAAAGDVTGLATATPATDMRPSTGFGRANLTASSAAKGVTVAAAAGTAQLGTVSAGPDTRSTGGGGISVTARAIDTGTANARNGALALIATAGRLYLGQGIAATTAMLDKQGTGEALHLTGPLTATGNASLTSATDIDLPITPGVITSGDTLLLRNSGTNTTSLGTAATDGFTLAAAEVNSLAAPKLVIDSRANGVAIGRIEFADATGAREIDLLGTGSFTLSGLLSGAAGAGPGPRTLQIGGATAGAIPLDKAIDANAGLAASITAKLEKTSDLEAGATLDWVNGTIDLRAKSILFGDPALRASATGTPDQIAVNLVERPNSPLYVGLQRQPFVTAGLLKVTYADYALFQNTGTLVAPSGAVLGKAARSVTDLALQLFSTGETPANSFALFGTINGFEGRTAGLLPAAVIDFAFPTPRFVRITQSNSRVNGCVIGSPDKGCLVTDAPPPNFQLFDERQILLFGTADDAGLTFDPLIGTNNESLIGDLDTGTLGINSIDCSAPGTRDCPAAGEKP